MEWYDAAGRGETIVMTVVEVLVQYCVPRILPSEFMLSFSQRKGDLMPAKNTYIAVSLLLTCCIALSLASCQSFSWHLAASKKGDAVELCLSNGDECPQPGG